MNDQSLRRVQNGYLLAMPILLALAGVFVSILFPVLTTSGRKILISISVLPILYSLYYMIVIPGWMPGSTGSVKSVGRVVLFVLVAVTIVAGALTFVLGE